MDLLDYFSTEALINIKEADLSESDILGDIISMREVPPHALLNYLLNKSNKGSRQGWKDYVNTIVELANSSKF